MALGADLKANTDTRYSRRVRVKTLLTRALVCATLVIAGWVLLSCGKREGAAIALSKTEFHFGAVPQFEKCSADLEIGNRGMKDLIISNVKGSCQCTRAFPSEMVIAPRQSRKVPLAFDTGQLIGKQKKTLYFETNDPAHHQMVVNLWMDVKPRVKIFPDPLNFRYSEPQLKDARLRRLFVRGPDWSFRIASVKPQGGNLAVESVSKMESKAPLYTITVRLLDAEISGKKSEDLIISTNARTSPDIKVTVIW